ncbi:MAG TPA: SCP2 sterol-binding domain-containing protein [Actinomycetota bacterium]|nr:SCP2 sterol-binding domain-containing protein [Actinomycetota bacterium]
MEENAEGRVPELTPEQFAELVGGARDEQIAEGIHAAGTRAALDRIFQGFEERFVPERAAGVAAEVQWVVTDGDEEFPYRLSIGDGTCTAGPGRADSPRVTLTTDLVSFAKLVTGHAQGPALFMTGKMKVQGDLMFGAQLNGYFERPGEGSS